LKAQEETTKDAAARAVSESGVMLCRHCDRAFVRQQRLRAHEDGCVEQLASRASKRKTAVLRPAADLTQDQVHSAASLSIGQGNFFRGQENKEMFFPKTIKLFPTPTDVPVKEGWEFKGVAGVKGGAFNKSQRDFLVRLFNNNGGPKIRERDAHNRMVTTFNDKNEDSDFSLLLVLSETQIKSWFSSEAGRRKKAAVNRAREQGFAELSQSIDMQDNNEEGGHDQNEGVPEEEFLLLSLFRLLLLHHHHFRTWFPDIFTVSGFLNFLD
jgi:hypothetical protein